jgi:hypothetical protein
VTEAMRSPSVRREKQPLCKSKITMVKLIHTITQLEIASPISIQIIYSNK